MAITKEEETVQLIFDICACTPVIKLNNNWQIAMILKKVYVIDGIVSLVVLY